MQFNVNAVLTLIAMTAAIVAAFFSWRFDDQEEMNKLNSRMSIIETELDSKAGQDALDRDVATLSDADEEIKRSIEAIPEPQNYQALLNEVMPRGAVMAFDLSKGCPKGWSEFIQAQSRIIIGAQFPDTSLDSELTPHTYDERGGNETIILIDDQLPTHAHKFFDTYHAEHVGQASHIRTKIKVIDIPGQPGKGGVGAKGRDDDNQGWQIKNETESAGNSNPVTIMPPYIALFYCTRD